MEGTAEGGQRVHGLLVVEAKDGVDSSGELRADCNQGTVRRRERKRPRTLLSYETKPLPKLFTQKQVLSAITED